MTWDGTKRGSSGKQKKDETGELEFVLFLERKRGRAGSTCGRKP